MPITIDTDLDLKVPSGNPDWLICHTDNYLVTAGTIGVWTFEMTTTPDNNSTMTFIFGVNTVVMNCKNTPVANGYDLNIPTGAPSMVTFVNYLKSNYLLNKYFTISGLWSSATGKFTFTQREITPDSILTYSFSTSPNANTSLLSTTAAVSKAYQQNFKLNMDVIHLYDKTDATKIRTIASLESTPQLSGANYSSSFDVQRIVRSLVSYNPPEFGETTHEECSDMIAYFGYQLYETYGSPILPYYMLDYSQPSLSNAWKVLLSRLLFAEHATLTFDVDYCTNSITKTLHRRPNAEATMITTNAAAPQYIYAYTKGATQVRTKMRIYYEDGTDSGDLTVRTLTMSSGTGHIIRTAVGYNAMGIGAVDPTKVVDYYKVWLVEQAGSPLITENSFFSLDLANYEQNNYILFSSAMGGFDTMWLRGEIGFNKEYFGDETVGAILPGYTKGNINNHNTGSQWMYEFNSGQLRNREEMRHYCQIAEAEEIYYVGETALIKLTIDRKSLQFTDNTIDSLYNVSFKCMVANMESE